MQKSKITLKSCILAIVVFYLLYVVLTAVFPAMFRKPVSDAFASSVSASNFYSDHECADRVALIESPTEGFESRLHLLDEATKRIDISYYAMHMGETTDLFLGAILNAADRGVQIRILVDDQFGGLTHSHADYATALGAHPNIELKTYNPLNPLKPWTWNGRLHDKYMIADNRLLMLGGRNIGDKYFDPEGYEKPLSLDRDVLIYNTEWNNQSKDSVLFDVRAYMDEIWNSSAAVQSFNNDSEKGIAKRESLKSNYAHFRQEHASLFDHSTDNYQAWTYPANRVSFIHNDTHIGVKEPKVGYIIGELLNSAKTSVTLQSPYVILDSMLKEQLTQIGNQPIDAKILTNSVGSSPNPIACTAYLGDRSGILNTGISLWKYQGDHSIHAKSYVIDDRITAVGSYNLDPRSAYLDTELLLVIDSTEFTDHFKQVQDSYFQQSLKVNDRGQYEPKSNIEARPISGFQGLLIAILYLPVKLLKFLA